MNEIKFSGVVEEDIYDVAGDELLMGAGDRVRGNLSFHDGTPYILGDIEDVCEEYCSPEYWYPVLENSIEAELFGTTIPLDRLRELAAAEREGRVVVLPCKVDTLRRSIDANVSEEVCLVEAEGLSRYGNCHLTCFDCYVNALAKAEAEAALAGKGETK